MIFYSCFLLGKTKLLLLLNNPCFVEAEGLVLIYFLCENGYITIK
jgi:hypothetical protein